jgi:peptide methionine sulfoxide reductase MsrA
VYFGAGCFWHVQHEFVQEEVAALKRDGATISAVSGYAGGKQLGKGGRVCYHNPQQVSDYGSLGHAEAVQLEIPASALPRFADKYFSLFGSKGIRHDPMDAGGEYRSVLGLPGGMDSPYFPVLEAAAKKSPMTLTPGRGDEGDTIRDKAVLVYDSNAFPFYAGERYHQFHNDFMGSAYGREYNELQTQQIKSGKLTETGCPEEWGPFARLV